MVWGGISFDGHRDLVVVRVNLNAAEHIQQILLQHVLVAAYAVGPEFVLMHENTRTHAVSSKLNPFKHVWDRLNRIIRGFPVPT